MRPSLAGVTIFSAVVSLCSCAAFAADTTAKPVTASPSGQSSFMPSAQDLRDPAEAPSEAKTQEIKDSRWVQPNQLKSTAKAKPAGSGSKISFAASCTDAGGKTFSSSDDWLFQMRPTGVGFLTRSEESPGSR